MQHRCLERMSRKRSPDVWQFRWTETIPNGKCMYHKKIAGTVELYLDEVGARNAPFFAPSTVSTELA